MYQGTRSQRQQAERHCCGGTALAPACTLKLRCCSDTVPTFSFQLRISAFEYISTFSYSYCLVLLTDLAPITGTRAVPVTLTTFTR